MDPHETLKVARTIKERGNDSFKRGQLPEAQRDYTEVLAILTEEITFTGDDQRNQKETLVLTAHLNLAQCALRLGDDARVIYHCNIALGMDSNNAKAHFRKARAFENRAEFAEALEGYGHVLTLEPDNETVQRQLGECQKKLDSQKAEEQMSNKMAGQKDHIAEDEDVEIVYKNSERDPQTRYKNCTKNPGHKNFINLKDFKIADLPPDYRDPKLFDHFKKHQSQITVLLKVWPPKKFTLGCGPGTGRNNSGNPGPRRRVRPLRHGSGWLNHVDFHTEDEQPCPCHTCKNSGSPEKKWADIRIHTAAHVVCNDEEANSTECYFFYDTEDVDLDSCPKLSNAVINIRDASGDECSLKFISHDENLFDQLDNIKMSYFDSLCSVKRKYKSPAPVEPGENALGQCEQLWQCYTEMMTEYTHLLKRVVAILNGNPYTEFEKHRKGRKDKTEDDPIGQMLLSKIRGRDWYQRVIDSLQREHETFCESLEKIPKHSIWLKEQPKSQIDDTMHMIVGWWQSRVLFVEQRLIFVRKWFDENVIIPPVEFNEDHRLTVIVSHPHGCSKKITIGELTDRRPDSNDLSVQYNYTTPTCPGSSGALVFVLGQGAVSGGHPHSANTSGVSLRQVNESAFSTVM